MGSSKIPIAHFTLFIFWSATIIAARYSCFVSEEQDEESEP